MRDDLLALAVLVLAITMSVAAVILEARGTPNRTASTLAMLTVGGLLILTRPRGGG